MNNKASVIIRAVGHVWRPSVFATMSLLMTLGTIKLLLEGGSPIEFMVKIPLYGLLLYMLWDYTRLTFKKVWNDR